MPRSHKKEHLSFYQTDLNQILFKTDDDAIAIVAIMCLNISLFEQFSLFQHILTFIDFPHFFIPA